MLARWKDVQVSISTNSTKIRIPNHSQNKEIARVKDYALFSKLTVTVENDPSDEHA